eukprot:TRINITY_DN19311_c2_g1_i1.p1 TRINITY_DN19311_c2_g1~~TRINITY_DN19311_c2_g1_i1.p1  ORF type:complete len:635 (-),score=214.05 TRINITY_DN19311_c2_g1_i1:72-1976(-)
MGKKGRDGGVRGKAPRRTGIEKYGQDPADAFLKLHDDDASEGGDSYGEEQEDIMTLGKYEGEDDEWEEEAKPAKKAGKKDAKKRYDEEDVGPVSKGWRSTDFYGGEDGGDDSEAGSDEDLALQEAKKLEELRALRLRGSQDHLAALLGGGDVVEEAVSQEPTKKSRIKGKSEDSSKLKGPVDDADDAQFESTFAAEAEVTSVGKKDLSKLSDAKRKSLLKKEAPELVPLLSDFQEKLKGLKQLLPLLAPKARSHLPASGASYIEAKACLLLNHLANLSYYLLLRAEGSDIKAHPVVSQLVWLKELQENLGEVDSKLSKKLKKAAVAAQEIPEDDDDDDEDDDDEQDLDEQVGGALSSKARAQESAVPKPKATLAERLARLKGAGGNGNVNASGGKVRTASDVAMKTVVGRTDDLLRLPSRRRRGGDGGEGPKDLDEYDPTLGAWMPSTNVSSQLSEVQQFLRERQNKSKPSAADVNPEPRARKARERVREELDPRELANLNEDADDAGAEGDDDDDGGAIIRQAKERAKAKKERMTAAEEAKLKTKLAKQYHPEKETEGRRSTSRKILENRGLARQRKKQAGNARVANRQKYEKLVKRRRGAVQDMREAAADGATYEGEATGVRTHLRKSQKLS